MGAGIPVSAGILGYRREPEGLSVLLVHPGGPYFRNRDLGSWSVPKGLVEPDEDPRAAAIREFREETGLDAHGPFIELAPIRQAGGKIVRAWATPIDVDPGTIQSNTFTLEWPPRSGRHQEFPEVDRAEYFDLTEARRRINPAQVPLLDELESRLS